MSRQLALVHTVPGLIPTFEALTKQHLDGWETFNIVDESLLRNSIREGFLAQATMRRLAGYVSSAVEAGADAVFVTCSSVGPAVDATRPFCPVPLVRVDEGMADEALDLGDRIGVLATLTTTLEPTRQLIERLGRTKGKSPRIEARVCEGAFELLSQGDREGHDRAVAEGLMALAAESDVVVLAQASMARVLDGENKIQPAVPVLSSPELGVLRLRSYLAEL